MLMEELVGKLQFLNKHGKLENINSGDQAEASAVAAVGVSSARLVSIVSFLEIFFMLTGENGLVCCFVALILGYGNQGQC